MDPVSLVLMLSAFLASHATGVAIVGAAAAGAAVAINKDKIVDGAKAVSGKAVDLASKVIPGKKD